MAKASTRLLERLAEQAQQHMPPAPMPQQSSRPNDAPAARPAPTVGQGRAVHPAVPPATPPIDGKLTLGAAVPPHVVDGKLRHQNIAEMTYKDGLRPHCRRHHRLHV